jgi:hypothetical protein
VVRSCLEFVHIEKETGILNVYIEPYALLYLVIIAT